MMMIKSFAIFTLFGSRLLYVNALTKLPVQRLACTMRPNSYALSPVVTQKPYLQSFSNFNLHDTLQKAFYTPPNSSMNELKHFFTHNLSKIRNIMRTVTNKFKHVIAVFLLAASLFISTPSAVFAAKSVGKGCCMC